MRDTQARLEALEVSRSFIVQAPAGSGKTELLTQRYLNLLSVVQAPEEIYALTFTRKAANEMRERILRALHDAKAECQPTSSHQARTLDLAKKALKQNNRLGFNLLQSPHRLKIMTIDALCHGLAQGIREEESGFYTHKILDNPRQAYQKAARAFLRHLIESNDYHDALLALLSYFDNNQEKIVALCSDLLAKREHWLPLLYKAKSKTKEELEQALVFIEKHSLKQLEESLPKEKLEELLSLTRELDALKNVCIWDECKSLSRALAKHLATTLLTTQNSLRKGFDHHVGLKKDLCKPSIFHSLKERSKSLLNELTNYSLFVEALISVKHLPEPHYSFEQWQILKILFDVLPLLVAHLQLVFDTTQETDFTAIAKQASKALGEEDTPTDLALYLDYAIKHVLIDEFQDTSIQQFELLTRLLQGFEHQDGRSLFIVGDPMQSIYRFRQAEVGLFLRAKHHGLHSIKLDFLALETNFRSTPLLVQWINDKFKHIFPQKESIEAGAIRFHPSICAKVDSEVSCIKTFCTLDKRSEASAITDLVSQLLTLHPSENIAVLVRSRHQLKTLIPILREKKIPFQGIEIDLIAHLPHIRDIWSLTQAILMPANRLVWLQFLRSPWCGLQLNDLWIIANWNKKKSIFEALANLREMKGLSEKGFQRARFIFQVLDRALNLRFQKSLIELLLDCLQQCHIFAVLTRDEMADLGQYWDLMSQFESKGFIGSLQEFKVALNHLYSKKIAQASLQIMTIHKSKGLEFDTVILPGLGIKTKKRDHSPLTFLRLPQETSQDLLLVSPIKSSQEYESLLYNYIVKLDDEKETYEAQRLFYVAVTRAKKRLYLFDCKEKSDKGSFREFLKDSHFIPYSECTEALTPPLPLSYQLPQSYYQCKEDSSPIESSPIFNFIDTKHRLIGIVIHRLLQWICTFHPTRIEEIPWDLATYQLKCLGLVKDELRSAIESIKFQIDQLMKDPIGQWMIAPHTNEASEYVILTEEDHQVKRYILDRTFIFQDKRWIIDFKTGTHSVLNQENYIIQLNQYANAFSRVESLPIICGLYYLNDLSWHTWSFEHDLIN